MCAVKLIDTTLRDGEQSAGLALHESNKLHIAKLLDQLGIYQIEAGIPAMGELEIKSIRKISEMGLNSRISTWNRMALSDIYQAMRCGNVVIHISVPASDLQIKLKLGKSRAWVADQMARCIHIAICKGHTVTVGFEDASRADFSYLLHLAQVASSEGASMVRYADTVGLLHPAKIREEIRLLKEHVSCDIGIHAHNDLGMAVANSVAAMKAGATFADTTVGGIGERAGNCNLRQLIKSMGMDAFPGMSDTDLLEVEEEILGIFSIQSPTNKKKHRSDSYAN